MSTSLTVALAGNPNVGKSTLFNALTGARQHVGNWPGKTVEKRQGVAHIEGREVVIVDLPGTYSLSAYSVEEIIARDFILNERPDAVVAVVDASNLERNLYLVTQVLELRVPVVLALNMSDQAQSRGVRIDAQALSARLGGVPVIETIGNRRAGIDALRQAILGATAALRAPAPPMDYGEPLETEIRVLQALVERDGALAARYDPRWLAVKLLENDAEIVSQLAAQERTALLAAATAAAGRIAEACGEDADTLIADRRYLFISDVVRGAVTRAFAATETFSDRIDRVATHRVWGVPIFLLLMWVVFQFTANVSAPLVDWVDGVIGGPVTHAAQAILGALGLRGVWVESLVVDGVIAGVGGVLTFVPVLVFLFFAIAVLEDTGYMARAAFVMDGAMRRLGLHGKSFLPMVLGFGCTVPAVYATRTLENEDDRKLTGFLLTFMSCGARLPVYVIFGAAFFGANAGNLVFAMYALGIMAAIATGLLIKRVAFRNKPPQPFLMELPPYRLPAPRDVCLQVRERTGEFLRKATTVILLCSVVIWLLLALPADPAAGGFNAVGTEASLFGAVSKTVAPVFAPAGFGTWEASGALITGLAAKEVIVGTMSQIYGAATGDAAPSEAAPTLAGDVTAVVTSFVEAAVLTAQETLNIIPRTVNLIPGVAMPEADFLGRAGDEADTTALQAALGRAFTPLAAAAFNVFVLLYVPCAAALATMRHEFGARWTLAQAGYTLVVAWTAAVLVYQIGTVLGF